MLTFFRRGMMKTKLFYLMVLLLALSLLGTVQADTTWTGDAGDQDWFNPDNWDLGIPDAADWAKIRNGLPGPRIDNGSAIASRVHIGYAEGGALTMNGGTLDIVGDDLLMGKNDNTGTLNMNGGTITVNRDLEVAGGDPGVINMTGGTIIVGDDFEVPESQDDLESIAEVYLYGGTIILDGSYEGDSQFRMYNTRGTMDITYGTLIVPGDDTSDIQGFVDNGWITAFGGLGTVIVDYNLTNAGQTTVRGIHPLNPSPAYNETVLNLTGTVPLSWTNLDPNHPGASVTVDVTFGTDPNKTDPDNTQLLTGSTLETVDATGIPVEPSGGPYYWWVDTYNGADEVIEGDTFIFYVTNDTPPTVVMDTPPMATWVNEPVQLDITVTDDGISPVTFLWEASDQNAVFSDNTAEDPTVSMNYPSGTFTVTVTVSDNNPVGTTASDSVDISCASSPCEAARSLIGLADDYPTDIVPDCMHDLLDFAELCSRWLVDYALTAPTPIP
jgi:hypothetical protein